MKRSHVRYQITKSQKNLTKFTKTLSCPQMYFQPRPHLGSEIKLYGLLLFLLSSDSFLFIYLMYNLRVGDSAGPTGWGPGDPAGGVPRPTPGDKQPTRRQGIQFISNIPISVMIKVIRFMLVKRDVHRLHFTETIGKTIVFNFILYFSKLKKHLFFRKKNNCLD